MIDQNTRIAAVVVTYNRKDMLTDCVDHLLAQTVRPLLDILVIDNASTDGTQESLRELIEGSQIIYVNTGSNLGGAGGFNYGMREAVDRGYDYVWVMDDDCLPTPNALEELLIHADALGGEFGWLSSRAIWTDGSPCEMNTQRYSISRKIDLEQTDPQESAIATFVSLLVPTSIIKEVGLPITEFFIWTDDWEFTRRISRTHPCYVIPSSVVVHASAENKPSDIVSEDNPDRFDRYAGMYRNSIYLYRREGLLGTAYGLTRAGSHVASIAAHAKSNRLERAKAVVTGTAKGFSFNPPIQYPSASDHVAASNPPQTRILEAFAEPISFGGEESFAITTLRHMDKTGFVIDFMTPYFCDNEAYREEVRSWGGEVYEYGLPFLPGSSRSAIREPLDELMSEHDYDIVHIHSGSITAATHLAEVAKQHGAKVIVHAHRGSLHGNLKHQAAMAIGAVPMHRFVDEYLSCSPLASSTLFPPLIAKHKAVVINNGVDVERFAFNEETRREVRAELDIADDALVIGHVGRLSEEKNHKFLLDVFEQYIQLHPNTVLLLVGEGDLRPELEAIVKAKGLADKVIFVGKTNDVPRYYMAMDVFAFPSIFEGLGIVAIEAQASGLPVIASNTVPAQIDVTGNVRFEPITDPQGWVNNMPTPNANRNTVAERILQAGFDVQSTAQQLRQIYCNLSAKEN